MNLKSDSILFSGGLFCIARHAYEQVTEMYDCGQMDIVCENVDHFIG